jgi:hypothetical protein
MATDHGDGRDVNREPERNPSVGYDQSDLGARGIVIFFVVLAVFAVAVHLCVLGLYVGMTRIGEKHDPELSPLAPKTVTPRAGILTNTANVNIQQFPEPRLLSDDTAAVAKLLRQETAVLTGDAWQDAQGNVHLPIEQAIQVVAPRLPVREGGAVLENYPGAGREYGNQPVAADEAAPVDGTAGNPATGK